MKRGVAFLRAVGMFGRNVLTKDTLENVLKDGPFRIVGIYGNDNLVFEKPEDLHFAIIGKFIENAIKKKLGIEIKVTTRSMNTLKRIIEKFG